MNPKQIIDWLKLEKNEAEGGYFTSTFHSSVDIKSKELNGFSKTPSKISICDSIYYFLDSTGCSVMHKVTGDMIYHFYSGDPVEMLLLYPEGKGFPNRDEVCIFSNNLGAGGLPAKVIPGGTWLGSRLVAGGDHALMGVTLAPGFNPADYFIGERSKLIKQYPQQKARITALTNPPKRRRRKATK